MQRAHAKDSKDADGFVAPTFQPPHSRNIGGNKRVVSGVPPTQTTLSKPMPVKNVISQDKKNSAASELNEVNKQLKEAKQKEAKNIGMGGQIKSESRMRQMFKNSPYNIVAVNDPRPIL